MIIIKSQREIELMRKAGALTAKVFEVVGPLVKPGVTTQYLADMAEKVILEGGGVSAEKGYCGFPGAICTSVNEVLPETCSSGWRHYFPRRRISLKRI